MVNNLRASINPRTKRASRVNSNPALELTWPNEIELNFDGFKDSDLESEWVTVEVSIISSYK